MDYLLMQHQGVKFLPLGIVIDLLYCLLLFHEGITHNDKSAIL